MNRRRFLLVSAGVASLSLFNACSRSEKEKKVNSKILESLRPFAFSRYLIDLPAGLLGGSGNYAELTYGLDANFTTAEVKLLATSADLATYKTILTKRVAEIASENHDKLKTSMLASNDTLSDTASLLRRYKSSLRTESFICELFALIGDVVVMIKGSVYENNIAPVESRLKNILTKITRPEDPTKAGKGFILGPLLIDAGQDQEEITLVLHDDARPDVWFKIDTNAIAVNPEKSLIARAKANKAGINALGVHWDTLRETNKTRIANMDADELLIGYKEEGKSGYLFKAETRRAKPSFEQQTLQLELETGRLSGGAPAESSLSKEEIIAVWDTAMKSVRLRPGAV
jgi:Tle cognate immunity protein 4 C-terminal domain